MVKRRKDGVEGMRNVGRMERAGGEKVKEGLEVRRKKKEKYRGRRRAMREDEQDTREGRKIGGWNRIWGIKERG